MRTAWVYIVTNKPNGVLYSGVTTNLSRRIHEHREAPVEGFTSRYGLDRLDYAETHDDIQVAITREKAMTTWNRAWKVRLIRQQNPDWCDLAQHLI